MIEGEYPEADDTAFLVERDNEAYDWKGAKSDIAEHFWHAALAWERGRTPSPSPIGSVASLRRSVIEHFTVGGGVAHTHALPSLDCAPLDALIEAVRNEKSAAGLIGPSEPVPCCEFGGDDWTCSMCGLGPHDTSGDCTNGHHERVA